jgi:hypothetical protein
MGSSRQSASQVPVEAIRCTTGGRVFAPEDAQYAVFHNAKANSVAFQIDTLDATPDVLTTFVHLLRLFQDVTAPSSGLKDLRKRGEKPIEVHLVEIGVE